MIARAHLLAAVALGYSAWACGSDGNRGSATRDVSAAGAAGASADTGSTGASSGNSGSPSALAGSTSAAAAGSEGEDEGGAGGGGEPGAVSGGAAAGGAGNGGSGGQVSVDHCTALPSCDAPLPELGEARDFRHWPPPIGSANHRGRDLFLTEGDPQWAIGNFKYGLAALESGLDDEEVDVYLLRDCGSSWEKLGTALTSKGGGDQDVEGVGDASGRFFFQIPEAKRLGLGRHRLRLVVGGDLSGADVFIEVVKSSTQIVVTDVDGTLTTSENAEFSALLTGGTPQANPAAAQVLTTLVKKGYRPFYLTARPEWLVERSREFLAQRNFPPGILHTTLTGTGATNAAAATFKSGELARLHDKGYTPVFAFGNTASDATAYDNAKIEPLDRRIFFKFGDEQFGGRRIENYGSLLVEMAELGLVCDR